MCGRYALNATPTELRDHFGDLLPETAWQRLVPFASYNIAPSLSPTVVRYSKRAEHNVIEGLVWGFRPQWAKRGWINARDDTLFTTSAFRESATRRRCLVAATGWYEWRAGAAKRKQPYYLSLGHVFAFAGIWTARKLNDSDWEASFAIVTTAARGLSEQIHDRMPLVLEPATYAAWLDPQTDDPQALLLPFATDRTTAYAVATLVNDPQNDGAECLDPAAALPMT